MADRPGVHPSMAIPASRPRALPLAILGAGGAIGVVIALALYGTKTGYVTLIPLGLAAILPSLTLKNARWYWFTIFLLSLQFQITKNLNDGFAVLDALGIDYLITHFTFDVSISDLALLALLVIWANDRLLQAKPIRFPTVSWLAVGYFVVALLSVLRAESKYLGAVEIFQQLKFFVAYLFAVNCLDFEGRPAGARGRRGCHTGDPGRRDSHPLRDGVHDVLQFRRQQSRP